MPHDSAPPDYGAKVLAKASFCPDFSVEAVKLVVIDLSEQEQEPDVPRRFGF
jgi:hypothetical protein